ncbi:hypothetical protein TWF106_002006 [Orbilia oligospora]|uniref:Uncharacterized protein n=1 Tax=Orbilia oligospora TaxID=2813651 RepID=A0A7C8QA90_ORBOL|nr:hypothetical protein TWF106_002006 [Orbilia oligospora]
MEMPTFATFQGNKVTSPNPSTTLTVGKPFLITWTNITATVENIGSYRWMVPRSIADRETYAIEMSYDSWMGNYSYSQPFAVMGAGVNPPTLPAYDTNSNVGLNWENSKAAVAAILAGVGLLVVAGTGYWIVNKRRNRAAEKRREEERRVREVKLGEMEIYTLGGVSGRTSVDGTV